MGMFDYKPSDDSSNPRRRSGWHWILRAPFVLVGVFSCLAAIGGYLEGDYGLATGVLVFGLILLAIFSWTGGRPGPSVAADRDSGPVEPTAWILPEIDPTTINGSRVEWHTIHAFVREHDRRQEVHEVEPVGRHCPCGQFLYAYDCCGRCGFSNGATRVVAETGELTLQPFETRGGVSEIEISTACPLPIDQNQEVVLLAAILRKGEATYCADLLILDPDEKRPLSLRTDGEYKEIAAAANMVWTADDRFSHKLLALLMVVLIVPYVVQRTRLYIAAWRLQSQAWKAGRKVLGSMRRQVKAGIP